MTKQTIPQLEVGKFYFCHIWYASNRPRLLFLTRVEHCSFEQHLTRISDRCNVVRQETDCEKMGYSIDYLWIQPPEDDDDFAQTLWWLFLDEDNFDQAVDKFTKVDNQTDLEKFW